LFLLFLLFLEKEKDQVKRLVIPLINNNSTRNKSRYRTSQNIQGTCHWPLNLCNSLC